MPAFLMPNYGILMGPLKRADSRLDVNYVIGSFSWSFEGLITYVNIAIT